MWLLGMLIGTAPGRFAVFNNALAANLLAKIGVVQLFFSVTPVLRLLAVGRLEPCNFAPVPPKAAESAAGG